MLIAAVLAHQSGAASVDRAALLRLTGLPMERLRVAANDLRDRGWIERVEPGIRVTEKVFGPPECVIRAVRGEANLPPGFVRCWRVYPNPENRFEALREWEKLPPDPELETRIYDALIRQIAAWQLQGRTADKCPHFRTWLHQHRWEGEVRVGPIGPPVSPRSLRNAMATAEAIRRRNGA